MRNGCFPNGRSLHAATAPPAGHSRSPRAGSTSRRVLKIVRGDLTLYATRHLMADWLDNSTIAKRTRDRILGHVTDVPGGYGRKGSINANQMAAISALESEIVKQMRAILVAAKDRAERTDPA